MTSGLGDNQAIEDGHVLLVERGSQGGVHIYGGLRTRGIYRGSEDDYQALLSGDRPLIEFSLENADGVLSSPNAMRDLLTIEDSGAMVLSGRRVVFRHYSELPDDWQSLDWQEIEGRLEQEEMIFSVLINDSRGRVLQDSATVRIDFPDSEQGMMGR